MKANKHLLLWSSIGTLVLLLGAAYQENFLQEWRVVQREYGELSGSADYPVQLRQIVVADLGATDRCVSCHAGMAPGESGIAGEPLLAPHPDVVHDPGEYGCVVCHGGQGRATVRADAHGEVPHWPQPMLPRRYAYAGCGSCHTHLAVLGREGLERGRALFERSDCLACHRLDGRGGTLRPGGLGGMEGPDLSRIGASGFQPGWYERHLARRAAGEPWASSIAPIPTGKRALIEAFLGSRVGAPQLVEAKALFFSKGCLGCHKVGGIGGDDGPDLTLEGELDPGQVDFSGVAGEHTIANWQAEHLRRPARVVADSQMPAFDLDEEEIEKLVLYLLSLRRRDYPGAYWPRDRVRAERLGEREFATDGATLFGTFCAACHGARGRGTRYPGMNRFPAISNPDLLALASDAFLAETIRRGRPGRRMPAWGEGNLREEEIAALVAHLRALSGGVKPEPDPRPARWLEADRGAGAALYAQTCAACHGASGGGEDAPALNNPVLLSSATDTYLVETILRGHAGTSMQGFGRPSPVYRTLTREEAESIAAHLRTWEDER